jgi:hypothetical protein
MGPDAIPDTLLLGKRLRNSALTSIERYGDIVSFTAPNHLAKWLASECRPSLAKIGKRERSPGSCVAVRLFPTKQGARTLTRPTRLGGTLDNRFRQILAWHWPERGNIASSPGKAKPDSSVVP